MRRLALATAVLASIATSRAVGVGVVAPEDPILTGVVVQNLGEDEIALAVAFAAGPNCPVLLDRPWLSTGVDFEEGVLLLIPSEGEVPLLEVLESLGEEEAIPECYVARLTLGDEVAVALVGTDRSLYGSSPQPGAPVDRLDIAVHPGAASVFVDGGVGLLQDRAGVETCPLLELPSWTPLEIEGFVTRASREADCIELTVEDELFQLCGVEDLAIDVGAPVRIHATEEVLDLDVFDGPRLVAGLGLERLGLDGEGVVVDGLCTATFACGGVTEGQLQLGEVLLGVGETVELEEGVLTVLAVDVPLQEGCSSAAEILYIEP